MLFAIVDIETTGGNPGLGGITEIAAILHDGSRVVDTYHTLINPQRPIPGFITGLTGIDQKMVENAPTFAEIADELWEFLEDAVFVAHNVNFDFSFIRSAFEALGRNFQARKLCTVRLSRKVFPGLRSYGLGRICSHLHIEIENRHRALGDAEATATLFGMMMEKDASAVFGALKQNQGASFLPPNISISRYLEIPEATGIYYFHDSQGQVIYVGKANNIRERFKGHFSGNSKDKLSLKTEIHDISWTLTGSEMLAYLLEVLEIKRIWPKYNQASKFQSSSWAIYHYQDGNGFDRLHVGKYAASLKPIAEFMSHAEAWKFLKEKVEAHELCPKLSGIQKTAGPCYDFADGKCRGACCGAESAEDYAARFDEAIRSFSQKGEILIKDRGISKDQQVALYFLDGVFAAYGYLGTDEDFSGSEAVLDRLQKVKPIPDTRYIFRSFLTKIPLNRIQVL